MNKKQKILAILGLSLVLFLFLANIQVSAQETPPTTTRTETTATTKETTTNQKAPAPDAKGETPSPAAEAPETIIGGIGIAVISKIFEVVNYIIGFIGGVLFNFAGGLIQFVLNLNFDILNNPLVTVGWQISRDLANLGFVLFIIIIAIATILRMQQYGAKSTLGKLIAVALLVNFSLVFAGVFIDFSNMLTNFFIKNVATVGPGGLASALANAFNIQKLLEVKDAEKIKTEVGGWGAAGALGAFGGGTLVGIASIFFVAIFTLLGAFSLLALAIMFLIRVIALAILLVLVPLACLFIILPVTKNLWDQWWKSFMKWIIFAPAASFFLYLSLAMAVNYGKAMRGMAQSAQGVGTTDQITFGNLLIKEPLEQMGNMIIIIGFMLGGLMAANSMGITGAKAFLGVAQAAGKWARGAIGRKTWEGVGGITGREGIRKLTEKMATSRIAPARWLGRGINRLGAQAERIPAEQYRKQIAGMSPQRANIEARSSTGLRRAVILNELAKKKTLSAETMTKYFSDPTTMANIEKDFKTGGLNFKDMEKATGRSLGMVKAGARLEAAETALKSPEAVGFKQLDFVEKALKSRRELEEETNDFLQRLGAEDRKKIQWDGMFAETENRITKNIQNQLAANFIKDPGNLMKITPRITKNISNYTTIINNQIEEVKKINPKAAETIAKALKKSLGNKIFSREMDVEIPGPTS